MNDKLENIYKDCINDLKKIGININDSKFGEIDISISNKNTKRYGCCKQEEPDEKSAYVEQRGKKKYIKYDRFEKHHIEISRWVMDLDDEIIKDTIMHEIIHCFPGCNNHGLLFKDYAAFINDRLGYNITRVGNIEEDYKKSNLEFDMLKNNIYKYKIICTNCGEEIYRKILKKNLLRNYRCARCSGRLELNKN